MDPQAPIFVFADDVESFDSLEALMRYIEAVDVEETTRFFDAWGQELAIRAVGVQRSRFLAGEGHLEMNGITAAESTQQFTELLRAHAVRLRQHLGARWTSDLDIAAADLHSLIDAVHQWTNTG